MERATTPVAMAAPWLLPLLLALPVVVLASCSPQQATDVAPVPETRPARVLRGFSLSPRSFEGGDFVEFFDRATDAGRVVMWAGDWAEVSIADGAPKTVAELASRYGYIPLIEATYYQQSAGSTLRPLDAENRQKYRESAVDFAAEYEPPYFGFGIEVNIMYEKSPDDFDEFVSFYDEVHDAVKAASPRTKVFTVFQLEKMKGLTFWSTAPADPRKAEWGLLDRFDSDLAVFSTYPGLVFKDPADIPLDYYAEIASHTSKPVAFTEIGWHSEAFPPAWESSEAEQAEFVRAFFRLIEGLDVEVAIWSFLYDMDIEQPFDTMGLRRGDGTGRPAWDVWLAAGE